MSDSRSAKPFDGIIADLKAAVSQPDITEFWGSTHRAQSVTELESTIEKTVGRTGATFDPFEVTPVQLISGSRSILGCGNPGRF